LHNGHGDERYNVQWSNLIEDKPDVSPEEVLDQLNEMSGGRFLESY
jgi:hypothetical protein